MTSVFIISAPSGSGKSTLVGRLLENVPNLQFSVSYTTRAPRGTERNGESYVFTTRDEFEMPHPSRRVPGTRERIRKLLRNPLKRFTAS